MHSNSNAEIGKLLLSFFPKTSIPHNKPMLLALKELIGHTNPKHAKRAADLMRVCMGLREKRLVSYQHVYNSDQIFHHCYHRLSTLRQEALMLIILDKYSQYRSDALIAVGSHAHSMVGIREIITPLLERRCPRFIMVHNHVEQDCRPSRADIELTGFVRTAVEFFDIALVDHILIANDEYYSFRTKQKFVPLSNQRKREPSPYGTQRANWHKRLSIQSNNQMR